MKNEEKLDLYFKVVSIIAKVLPFYLAFVIVQPNNLLLLILYFFVAYLIYRAGELFVQKVNFIK